MKQMIKQKDNKVYKTIDSDDEKQPDKTNDINKNIKVYEIKDLDKDKQIIYKNIQNNKDNTKQIKPIQIDDNILAIIASDYCKLREKIIMTMVITGIKTDIYHHDKHHPLFNFIWKSEKNQKKQRTCIQNNDNAWRKCGLRIWYKQFFFRGCCKNRIYL